MSEIMRQVGEFVPDKLIAGNQVPILTKAVTLAAGTEPLTRGTLIAVGGIVAKKEGSTPDEVEGILCDDTALNADGTTEALMYITGEFLGAEITVGDGAIITDFEREARKLGIIIR